MVCRKIDLVAGMHRINAALGEILRCHLWACHCNQNKLQ